MAYNTLICITVLLFTITHAVESNQHESSITKEPECTQEGTFCIDCWRSLNCIDLGNGQFYSQVQICPLGRSCRNSTGYCEDHGNYQCDSLVNKVYCTSEGVFPDPYNCQRYFHCLLDDSGSKYNRYDRNCPESLAFDSFTKQCTKPFDGTCLSQVPICNNETQTGKISENPNIYYSCSRQDVSVGYNYLPQLYSCPQNYYFDGESCRDSFYTGRDEDGLCEMIGWFWNSTTDCRYYNRCDKVGEEPIIDYCSYKFSPAIQNCINFSCNTCKG